MRIVFMGTPRAAVPSLERLKAYGHEIAAVYTQPDRPSGRGNKVAFSPVKQFAVENSIPVLQPLKIRTTEALDEFRSHAAEAAVVVAYGRILPEPFLSAFPLGAVNVHFSLLPKYRGAAPVNWAIVNGETVTGVTTMKMDAGLDTGDILLHTEAKIGPDEDAISLMERLSVIGAQLLTETLAKLQSIVPRPQNHALATHAPILKKVDGEIDWSKTATEIFNRVRGFQPFPASYTFFRGQRLSIHRAEVLSETANRDTSPGEMIHARGTRLEIACGGGTFLGIKELQPEGKRRMPVSDFINGMRPAIGEFFGR